MLLKDIFVVLQAYIFLGVLLKTSLLCRLQEQTLADEAPPMGKIHPLSQIAVTFEPVMQFGISLKIVTQSIL